MVMRNENTRSTPHLDAMRWPHSALLWGLSIDSVDVISSL